MGKRIFAVSIFLLANAWFFMLPGETTRTDSPADSPSVLGTWIWAKDSDGQTPVKGSVISILFQPQGAVDFSAFRPGEEVEDHGQWSVTGATSNGGSISLELP